MLLCRLFVALLLIGTAPEIAAAQSDQDPPSRLFLELNTLNDTGEACRLTFVVQNKTGIPIEKAVFETVIFDISGGVASLSLFDFRELPADRPRVRQFDLAGKSCGTVGKVLINGASTCVVGGAESDVCRDALSLSSRLDVELLG